METSVVCSRSSKSPQRIQSSEVTPQKTYPRALVKGNLWRSVLELFAKRVQDKTTCRTRDACCTKILKIVNGRPMMFYFPGGIPFMDCQPLSCTIVFSP
ncbi:hypothetical protein L6452_22374 [Arctium lappa]|uniref:Uncharacterized protein n=1 Tax=Arctium lappa TaxID=4217 RepID=A0ACB9AZX6_ARCLA|nr:hypothetical protein L6452_22374 [Arctium lappa]